MRVALAAGGTGGHMFPAQALAEEAKARGWSVLLLTDKRGERYTERFPKDDMVLLKAASPSARGLIAKIRAGTTLAGGIGRASRALKAFEADTVIGFGGYPSAPAMLAAQRLRLPTGIHEQNAVLGRANRLAAGHAGFIAHAFPILKNLPKGKFLQRETGNPVRQAVVDAARIPFNDPSEGPIRLLIFGGSQGAALFAAVFAPAIAALPEALRRRLDVVHQVQDTLKVKTAEVYDKAGVQAEVAPFFDDLPARIAKAHLVVARSGASSVTELAVIGRPSLLVPLKIAMDDHQTMNAQVLTEAGAATLIAEDDLTEEAATVILTRLLSDAQGLTQMAQAAKGRMEQGAAQALADLTAALAEGSLAVQ
ncbi:MAG: undecaprenyldiphospho-muramoylpentapeptide beta-N-acetylglucosaminyltransferase [Pseudomonadota bacterium]